jgi:formyltetrahydrofolate hydrolase
MSDEADKKNILAVNQYAKETRLMFRELEIKQAQVQAQNEQLRGEVQNLREQLQIIMVKMFSGGATS